MGITRGTSSSSVSGDGKGCGKPKCGDERHVREEVKSAEGSRVQEGEVDVTAST